VTSALTTLRSELEVSMALTGRTPIGFQINKHAQFQGMEMLLAQSHRQQIAAVRHVEMYGQLLAKPILAKAYFAGRYVQSSCQQVGDGKAPEQKFELALPRRNAVQLLAQRCIEDIKRGVGADLVAQ